MAKRFHDLELSSDWAHRQNCAELSKRGFRMDEPGGMRREHSRVFSHVFSHLRGNDVTTKDVADHLGVPVELLHQLTFAQLPIAVAGRDAAGRDTAGEDTADRDTAGGDAPVTGRRPDLRLIDDGA